MQHARSTRYEVAADGNRKRPPLVDQSDVLLRRIEALGEPEPAAVAPDPNPRKNAPRA